MTSVNRFALLDDDEPVVKAVAPAAAPAPTPAPAAQPAQQQRRGGSYNNYNQEEHGAQQEGGRGGRGGYRGRGGRGGGDRPYRPRSAVDGPRTDGESNPRKREFDGHYSRKDFTQGGGRGRGGAAGERRRGGGRYNSGAVSEVAPEQSAEEAIGSLPAAEGEAPATEAVAEEAAPVVEEVPAEPEEVDTTITLAQFLASKAKLDADSELRPRQAGEDVVEDDENFQTAKQIVKKDVADFGVLGAASGAGNKKEASNSGPKLVQKKALVTDIDVVFAAPAGRGGRGGFRGGDRGGYRGGDRGGYRGRGRGPAPVNIDDANSFPSLSSK